MEGLITTTASATQMPVISEEYVALLEKVESVHGVGLALANTFIVLLSAVLILVSIAATYLMWRNSREQKEERNKAQERYHEELKDAQDHYSKKLEDLLKIIQKQADGRIQEIGVGASEETEEKIEKLKEELLEIKKATASAVVLEDDLFTNPFGLDRGKKAKVCEACGKYFSPNHNLTNNFPLNTLSYSLAKRKTLCEECLSKK